MRASFTRTTRRKRKKKEVSRKEEQKEEGSLTTVATASHVTTVGPPIVLRSPARPIGSHPLPPSFSHRMSPTTGELKYPKWRGLGCWRFSVMGR
ncbi:hypothetical protein V6N11_043757 [Hibiscus sabdariffa]|uniref:Uncharacterized protein n=1 Tax=Hibiscus sabdariffa TaxID=183260 RepID=A0ABR2RD59_9ROSI